MDMIMSLRTDGSMAIPENRIRFLSAQGISPNRVVSAGMVHGNKAAIVSDADAGTIIPQTDGLITDTRGLFLAITVADCLPVTIHHPQKSIVALLHAGWRGLHGNIIGNAVNTMREKYTISPQELTAKIGPGIGPCHFEVQQDLVREFSSYPDAVVQRGEKTFLDLKLIARTQLRQSGIVPENIASNSPCTFCEADTYFSYRKDKTIPINIMMVLANVV